MTYISPVWLLSVDFLMCKLWTWSSAPHKIQHTTIALTSLTPTGKENENSRTDHRFLFLYHPSACFHFLLSCRLVYLSYFDQTWYLARLINCIMYSSDLPFIRPSFNFTPFFHLHSTWFVFFPCVLFFASIDPINNVRNCKKLQGNCFEVFPLLFFTQIALFPWSVIVTLIMETHYHSYWSLLGNLPFKAKIGHLSKGLPWDRIA